MTAMKNRRLVVVSNRLPIVLKRTDGSWSMQKGSGGLVTALGTVLKNRGGLWVGWPGSGVVRDGWPGSGVVWACGGWVCCGDRAEQDAGAAPGALADFLSERKNA